MPAQDKEIRSTTFGNFRDNSVLASARCSGLGLPSYSGRAWGEIPCEWKSNMVPVTAIQNGSTRFIATPTGQASRRPRQASPEPAAPHICGRLWARPAYNSRSFFRPRLALSAPDCWPPKRAPSQIIPLFYPCFSGTGSVPPISPLPCGGGPGA